MRVMWICASFSPLAKRALCIGNSGFGSGNWVDDEAAKLVSGDAVNRLFIISSAGGPSRVSRKEKIEYVNLEAEIDCRNDVRFQSTKRAIGEAIGRYSPDLVQVWGTERPFSTAALETAREAGIRTILCPQGIVASLLHFPNGGVSAFQMCGRNPLNWLKMPLFNATKRTYRRNQRFECRSIELADYILSDNEWTFDYCSSINPDFIQLHYPLPVNRVFVESQWKPGSCAPHSILSVSSRSSYKGQHVLIKAVARLKRLYPDVRVFFPAMKDKVAGGFVGAIKRTPYIDMIKRLIAEYGLEDAVVFLDSLSPAELAQAMQSCSLFINPSVIESNCMSLREAMWMGMPVISSFAGSIQEYLQNDVDGVLYRYEEDEILAREISRLFEDPYRCVQLGNHARMRMERFYSDKNAELSEVYASVLKDRC